MTKQLLFVVLILAYMCNHFAFYFDNYGRFGTHLALIASRSTKTLKREWTIPDKLNEIQQTFALSSNDLTKLITKYPMLLSFRGERHETLVSFFIETIGLPRGREEFRDLAWQYPALFGVSIRTVQMAWEMLRETLGFSESEARRAILREPSILSKRSLRTTPKRIAFLIQELQLPSLPFVETRKFLLKEPKILVTNPSTLRRNFAALKAQLPVTAFQLKSCIRAVPGSLTIPTMRLKCKVAALLYLLSGDPTHLVVNETDIDSITEKEREDDQEEVEPLLQAAVDENQLVAVDEVIDEQTQRQRRLQEMISAGAAFGNTGVGEPQREQSVQSLRELFADETTILTLGKETKSIENEHRKHRKPIVRVSSSFFLSPASSSVIANDPFVHLSQTASNSAASNNTIEILKSESREVNSTVSRFLNELVSAVHLQHINSTPHSIHHNLDDNQTLLNFPPNFIPHLSAERAATGAHNFDLLHEFLVDKAEQLEQLKLLPPLTTASAPMITEQATQWFLGECSPLSLGTNDICHVLKTAPQVLMRRVRAHVDLLASLSVTLAMTNREMSRIVRIMPRLLNLSVKGKLHCVLSNLAQLLLDHPSWLLSDSPASSHRKLASYSVLTSNTTVAASVGAEMDMNDNIEEAVANDILSAVDVAAQKIEYEEAEAEDSDLELMQRASRFLKSYSTANSRAMHTTPTMGSASEATSTAVEVVELNDEEYMLRLLAYRAHPLRRALRRLILRYPHVLMHSLNHLYDRFEVAKRLQVSWKELPQLLRRSALQHERFLDRATSKRKPLL